MEETEVEIERAEKLPSLKLPVVINIDPELRGCIGHWFAYSLPDTAALSSITSVSKKIQRKKLSMMQKLINGAALSKVDSGLKMLIEPI